MSNELYKATVLDHFHNPRNKGELPVDHVSERGRNPQCGDDVEVTVSVDTSTELQVRFRGRGCSICLASASVMASSCDGLSLDQAAALQKQTSAWLSSEVDHAPNSSEIRALDAVRNHITRQKCALLAWHALGDALEKIASFECSQEAL